MIAVIDTSALIRLFVPDGPLTQGLEEFLNGVERGRNTAIAPELLMVEAANALNKKRNSGELSDEEGRHLLTDVLAMPIRFFPHRPLIPRSFELAREHDLTVYDALYLALAIEHGAGIFSADKSILKVAGVLGL
ncbi:MAG: type II toxin-antitoxin system VapC family toxin [Candidatus Desulfatibia sp.]|uniref:type II toxin-antitoxin system VapC family toxin n=1 Tax=Candidatus Desulfatibia sp. TaxID=3101189 RepID=UPI002F2C92E1